MKKILRIFSILFFLNFLLIQNSSYAQVYTGGNASVSFTNNNTYIDVAPILGYQMGAFRLGISPMFAYNKAQFSDARYTFGGRFFSQLTVFKGLFLHAEAEGLNVEDYINRDAEGNIQRKWVFGLPVGAGYSQSLGDRVNVQFMVLYNVIQNNLYPYENPIFRGGINYSF